MTHLKIYFPIIIFFFSHGDSQSITWLIQLNFPRHVTFLRFVNIFYIYSLRYYCRYYRKVFRDGVRVRVLQYP